MNRDDRKMMIIAGVWILLTTGLNIWSTWQDPRSFLRTGEPVEYGCIPDIGPGIDMGNCP